MQTSQGRTVLVKGRIVWVAGDLFKGQQKTDMMTKRPLLNDDGTPKIQYGFGLAVPKEVLGQTGEGQPGELWAAIYGEAQSLYQNAQIPPQFAFKYKDGDGVDDKGQPFANREGYKGCLVFALTTAIPIRFFKYEHGVGNVMVNEGVKCGDEVVVQVNVKAHLGIGQGKPGMYLNPLMVQLFRVGEPIINMPDANSVFGAQAPVGMDYSGPAVPQGAVMNAAAPAPGAPQAPASYPAAPQAAPAPGVQPHYGVLPQAHQPQPTAPVPQPPTPASYPVPGAPQAAPQGVSAPGMPPIPGGFPQR